MGSPTVMGSELLILSQDHLYRVQETSDHRWLSCRLPMCSAGDITTMNQRDVGKCLMMSHGCQEEPLRSNLRHYLLGPPRPLWW